MAQVKIQYFRDAESGQKCIQLYERGQHPEFEKTINQYGQVLVDNTIPLKRGIDPFFKSSIAAMCRQDKKPSDILREIMLKQPIWREFTVQPPTLEQIVNLKKTIKKESTSYAQFNRKVTKRENN